jgi:eukaryotic-like serine/threonine-protein kinase
MVNDVATYEPGAVLPGTPYLVGRGLGRGGMGTVYDTTDLETGERYAVKVLSTRFAGRADLEERILREAAVLGALAHPNIVRVHRTGYLATGLPFYAMERLEGQTLRDLLRRRGPLAPSFACDLARQVLEALGVVHEAGLVHRDVKPENLVLRTDGTCVLLDFGLVKILTDMLRIGPKMFDTAPGGAVGTYRYMAPESFDGRREPLVHLVDIYAVGVVLIELLTGRLPLAWLPRDVYLTYLARYGFPRSYDGPLGPRVPDVLRPLVERATARNPSERFPSAWAFADELARACQRGGVERHDAPPGRTQYRSSGTARVSSVPPRRPAPYHLVSSQFVAGAVSGVVVSSAVSALAAWLSSAPAFERVVTEPRPAPLAAEPRPALPAAAPPAPPSAPPALESPTLSVPASASARPPSAPASAGLLARRAQLLAKLRSGQATSADAEKLFGLCRDLGDAPCRQIALTFLQRYGAEQANRPHVPPTLRGRR